MFLCVHVSDQLKHLNTIIVSVTNEYKCPIRIEGEVIQCTECIWRSSRQACRTPSNRHTLTVAQIPTLDALVVLIGYVDRIAFL